MATGKAVKRIDEKYFTGTSTRDKSNINRIRRDRINNEYVELMNRGKVLSTDMIDEYRKNRAQKSKVDSALENAYELERQRKIYENQPRRINHAYDMALRLIEDDLKQARETEEETGTRRKSAYDAYSPLLSERLQSSFSPRASLEDELLGNKSQRQSVFSPQKTMQQEVLDAYDRKIAESDSPVAALVRNGLGVTQNTNPYADAVSKFRSSKSDFVTSRAENEAAKQNVSALKNTQSILQLEQGALDIPESKVYGKQGSNSVFSGETANIAYLLQNPGRNYIVDTEETSDRVAAVSQMSSNEKTVFLKYYGSGETEKAQQYFDALLPTLYARQFAERKQQIDDASKFTQTMRALGGSFANVGAYAQAAADLVTGRQPEMNAGAYAASRLSSFAREQSMERLNDTGKFLASVGYSMADNALAMTLGETGALIWMGLSAAGAGTVESLEKDNSLGKSFVLGTFQGGIETATEKMGIDNLFRTAKSFGKTGVKNVLLSMAKQGGAEGLEEVISEFANTILDLIANGQDADFYRTIENYRENGLSDDDAKRQATIDIFFKNPALAGLAGTLSGVLFGTVSTAKAVRKTVQYAKSMKASGIVPDVIQAALNLDPNGEYQIAYRLAQKLESDMRVRGDVNGERLSNGELTALAQAMPEGAVKQILDETEARKTAEDERRAETERAAREAAAARAEQERLAAEAQQNAENEAERIAQSVEYQTAARQIVGGVLSAEERRSYRNMVKSGIDAESIWQEIASRHEAEFANLEDADDALITAVYNALQDRTTGSVDRGTVPNGYTDADARQDIAASIQQVAESAGIRAEAVPAITAAADRYYESYAGANFSRASKDVRNARNEIFNAVQAELTSDTGEARTAEAQRITTRITESVESGAKNVGADVPAPVVLPSTAQYAQDGVTEAQETRGEPYAENYTQGGNASYTSSYGQENGAYVPMPENGSVNGASLRGAGAQYAESIPQTSAAASQGAASGMTSENYRLSKQGAQIRDDALASLRLLVNDNEALSVTDREVEIANIAGKLGVKLRFQVLGDNINGLYKNGVIYLNPQSSQQYTVVFAHELMHLIEQRGAYADIRTIVKNGSRVQETGATWDELVSAMRDQYADNGFNLSRSDAEYELIANIVGEDYLSDADALAGIVGSNRKLGRVILDWVNRLVGKLSGEEVRAASDEVNLLRLQAAVEEALSEKWNVPETEKQSAAISQQQSENAAVSQQTEGKQSVGNFSLNELAKAAREKNRGVDEKTADQNAIDRGRETFLRTVGRAYNIPKAAIDGEIRNAVKAFDEAMQSDRDYRESMTALARAIIRNEGNEQQSYKIDDYQNVRDYLRNTRIKIDDSIRSAIPDFNDFRKSHMGKMLLSKDGLDADVAYMELSSMAPGLFKENNISKQDQFLRIAEVADMLFEKTDMTTSYDQSSDRSKVLTNAFTNYLAIHNAAKYGTIGYGTQYRSKDNPKMKTDKVKLPKRMSADTKTHQGAVTFSEAAATKNAAKLMDVNKLLTQYHTSTNAEQVSQARALRDKYNSLEAAAQKFLDMADHPTRRNKDLVDTIAFGELLLIEASNPDSMNMEILSDILPVYYELSEVVGKGMQVQTLLKKLSPDGQLMTMEKTFKRSVDSIRNRQSKSEQRKVEREVQNSKDRADVSGDIYDIVKEIQKLTAKMQGGLVSQQEGQTQLDELRRELFDKQRQLRRLVRAQSTDVDADIADVLSDLYSVTQNIETEASKLDPSIGVLNALKSELRRKKARLKNLSASVEAKNSDASRAERNEEIRKVREEIDAANREIDALTEALGKKDLAEARRQLASAKRRLENLRSTFDERRGAIEAKTNESLKQLNATMKELLEKRGILDDARAEYLEAAAENKKASSDLARVNREINRLNEKIQKTRNDIDETIAAIDLANETKAGLETLSETLKMYRKLKNQWKDYIDMKGSSFKIPDSIKAEFLAAKSQEERDAVADRAVSIIAAALPGTPKERLRAWRYLSMLGNVRTHIRNIMGNTAMFGAREVKDVLGAGLEFVVQKGIAKKGLDRTKAVMTASARDRALLNAAETRFKEVRDVVEGNKYTEADKIEERRKIFKTAAMEWISKKNSGLLTAEDSAFLWLTFRSAYAQYLKANGYNAEDVLPDDFKTRATEYAIKEAQEATFHDASNFARLLNKLERSGKASGYLFGGLMPFKQTPINIAKRMVEYSPASLISGTVDLFKSKNTPEMMIDGLNKLAKGLTGAGLMTLGFFLAKSGILVAGGDPDEPEKETAYQKLFGRQMYAINGDGWSYTIDWLAPAVAPLTAGAFLYESFTADGFSPDDIFKIFNAAASILNPLLELSMLDGISSALKSYESGTQQLVDIGFSIATSYLGQYIPTLFGQIARTVDSVQRSTYAAGDSKLEKTLKKFLYQTAAKIPWLSKVLDPALDAHGNPVEREGGNWFGRLILNMISPGYLSISDAEDVDRELMRLYEQTGNTGVLPKSMTDTTYITVDGENLKFSEAETAAYFQRYGTQAFEELGKLIGSDGYRDLTDAEKEDLIEDIFKEASEYAKTEFLIDRGLYDGIAKEYFDARLYGTAEKERNAPAYMERLRSSSEFSDARLYRIDQEELAGKTGIELYQALSALEDVSEDDKAFLYLFRSYGDKDDTAAKNAEMVSSMRTKGVTMDEFLEAKLALFDSSGNAITTTKESAAALRRTSLTSSDKFTLIPYLVSDSKSMAAAIADAKSSGMSANKLLEHYEKYQQIIKNGKEKKVSASDQNLEWSRYLVNLNLPSSQFLSLKGNFTFSQYIPIDNTVYDRLIESGVSDKTSAAIVQATSLLEPEEGKKDVTMYQRAEAAYSVASGKEAETAVMLYLGEYSENFVKDAKEAGVSLEVYVKYRKSISGLEADKDPKTGKAITNSLKKKVCAKIDAIPGLTTAQKDGLFLLKYEKSGLYDTPWH